MMIFTNDLLQQIKITPLLDTLRLENISDASYFGEHYSDYISHSRMGLINPAQGGTPEAYFHGLSNNAKFTTSLAFGSAVHELTLQPELFHMCTSVDRPTSKAGFMADELFEEYKKNPSLRSEALIKASDKVDYYKGKFDKEKQDALLSKCSDYWEDRKKYESSSLNSTPIYLDAKSR